MSFSEETRSYDDTRKRTSSEYVKFTEDYRVVLRILDEKALMLWRHWVPQANGGRGMFATCANTSPGLKICPIDESVAHLPKESEERKALGVRRRFVVNVLDRTPYTTCKHCNTQTPGKRDLGPVPGKVCVNCGGSLKGQTFAPLNRIKLLDHGPRLFNQQLNIIESMQREDIDKGITEYDITFTTVGEGRDKIISAHPQDPEELDDKAFLDSETGEPQVKWNLETLAEVPSTEELTLILQGATPDQLNAVRGIE